MMAPILHNEEKVRDTEERTASLAKRVEDLVKHINDTADKGSGAFDRALEDSLTTSKGSVGILRLWRVNGWTRSVLTEIQNNIEK
ncbi:hypothetical protein AcW1_005070 [Taiwanofungus camphoratus]|nr:hypothetical protein AcW2_005921 [Antrodia cinnamomea]KAI0960593.1 hypothetical protein AcW1_005070 [Antrodia cinnamomea]